MNIYLFAGKTGQYCVRMKRWYSNTQNYFNAKSFYSSWNRYFMQYRHFELRNQKQFSNKSCSFSSMLLFFPNYINFLDFFLLLLTFIPSYSIQFFFFLIIILQDVRLVQFKKSNNKDIKHEMSVLKLAQPNLTLSNLINAIYLM